MQAWLALAHASAAAIATAIAVTHYMAVIYHVRKIDAALFPDTPEDHDLSFEQAKAIAARRQR